jgi:hypothetical protein
VCSKDALVRPGVLNELEQVLEREAREGGAAVLLPVRLDDFVMSDWAPERKDLARQVRSRVIGDFSQLDVSPGKFEREMRKVLAALSASRMR